MKIHQVEAELFHAHKLTDGQTDLHDEINSYFSQFSNAPRNVIIRQFKVSIVPYDLCYSH
jgi:hypothetical protein